MSFKEAVQSAFGKYCCFSGRARRSEYWYFTLFNILASLVIGALCGMLFGSGSSTTTVVSGVWALAMLLPGLGLCWRRLHDIGKSGAWYLLIFVPLIGAIILLIWFCTDSQPGTNQYGPNPKEPQDPQTTQAPW